MDNQGWITLHRKLLEWEWWDDHNTTRLFLYLLLKANHEPKKWRGIVLARGQLITGLFSLREETGISYRSLRTSLTRLESTGEISRKTTNKYSVITVTKYDDYQDKQSKATIKRQSNDNQTTTNNNDNNILLSKDNNTKSSSYGSEILNTFMEYVKKNNNGILPVADTDKKTRYAYWNILQRFGVERRMKLNSELTQETKDGLNKFFEWYSKNRVQTGYGSENVYTLKQNVNNFLTNYND